MGKAKEVPSAIRKGIEIAKKNLIRVPLAGSTIPHTVTGRFGAGRVLLKPAPEGTAVDTTEGCLRSLASCHTDQSNQARTKEPKCWEKGK